MSFRPLAEARLVAKMPLWPRVKRLWSTASLRMALTFSLIFGVGCALLIGGVEYALFRFIEAEVRADLTHQVEIMAEDEARLGGIGLVRHLQSDAHNHEARRYLFLVVAKDGTSFSNGLTKGAVNPNGFRRNMGAPNRAPRWPDQRPNMLVFSQTTPDGTLLAIGRDTQHLDELLGGIRSFAFWSALGAALLAVLAGLVTGYLFLRRLEGVNAAVDRVASGDFSGRLPAIGFGREFDELAAGLNRMLDRQEAMLDTLKTVSDGIAHDLRTPLGRLRNRLEDLALDLDNPTKREEMLDLAMQEIVQITSLFESLLALSRLEGGTLATKSGLIDGGQLVQDVGEIYRPMIEDAGGLLHIKVADGALDLMGDRSLITQALANLVDNAVVHATAAPDICISAQAVDGYVRLSVADRGAGIPAHERDKVIKRFYRMDRSRTRSGSGIGLAMCQAVVDWHKGRLALGDNGPGLRVDMDFPSHSSL